MGNVSRAHVIHIRSKTSKWNFSTIVIVKYVRKTVNKT